ncbi:MAG TPA: aminotransferase class IV, partial [Desulfopila sp.]|nr:aminotransferase class IV [Desulfopila sp.]
MAIYYVDGEFVDSRQAALPLSDMAILRGYAVFDYLRTYNGTPFYLNEHLQRLQKSAALLHLDCPWPLEYMEEKVLELLRKNTFAEATVRLLITGGDSIDSITPGSNPRLIIMVAEMKPFPSHWYTDGVKVITAEVSRYIP